MSLELERAEVLRYGENPHQQGARYRLAGAHGWWDEAVQHGGKAMSYLNVYDTEAAWRLVNRFDRPAAVIVKHANPCGVAIADDIVDAYKRAHECDPVSAFGGIVALNRPVPVALAESLAPVFTEVVVAPEFDADALAVLTAKKNLRVLSAPPPGLSVSMCGPSTEVCSCRTATRSTSTARRGGSSRPPSPPTRNGWISPSPGPCALPSAATPSCMPRTARRSELVPVSRTGSTRRGSPPNDPDGRAAGGVCASDAFFPFRDGLDAAAAAGITAVIQPGGSMRDEEVIAAADEHGIAMVFTAERHFRH